MARTSLAPPDESPAARARREKAERLAQALRANLKRRKAAPAPRAGDDDSVDD